MTTFNGGSLGSCIDEERSELRYVMWIAEFSESSNLWTHIALQGLVPVARLFECQIPFSGKREMIFGWKAIFKQLSCLLRWACWGVRIFFYPFKLIGLVWDSTQTDLCVLFFFLRKNNNILSTQVQTLCQSVHHKPLVTQGGRCPINSYILQRWGVQKERVKISPSHFAALVW